MNIIRQTCLFITAVMAMALLTACADDNRTILENAVEEVNAECPMEFDEGICMIGSELSDEDMIYYYEFDEDLHGIQEYVDIQPSLKKEVFDNLISDFSDESNAFYKVLVEEEMGIRYIFIGSNSEASFELTITPDEVFDIYQSARK